MTDDKDDTQLDRPMSSAQRINRDNESTLERILRDRGLPYYQSKEQQ